MKIGRFLRVTAATGMALTTAASTFVIGCATKPKPLPPPLHGDPPLPLPPRVCSDSKPIYDYVLFENNKTVLPPNAKSCLDMLCADLKAYPKNTINIVGHTSDTGPAEYNMELGKRRAESVKAYLVEQGIAPERLTVESKGETAPCVPNDTPENRKLNRYVNYEITMHGD